MTTQDYNSKIDPSKRTGSALFGRINPTAPGNPALLEWDAAGLAAPDMTVMRQYRLDRVRAELRSRDLAGCILYDPLNIRYALDAPNMQVWCTHNAVRYAYIATEGPVVLFDFARCEHLTDHLDLITERRDATSWFYFENGNRVDELVVNWADELAELIIQSSGGQNGGGNHRIAIDKCEMLGITTLIERGIDVTPGTAFMEHARYIKHAEEIKALRRSINTTEVGMAEMWRALEPGITENQVWSILHQASIARGGEWVETRLLCSGQRTNPWFAESSDRIIEAGDILAFDTDLIGPYGYCTDISRSWVTPGKAPTQEQIRLHAIACEMVEFNIDVAKPGMSFKQLAQKSFQLDTEFMPNRYAAIAHGAGLADEYPAIRYIEDWDKYGYEGIIEANTVLCFESYVGAVGGSEGIKVERQVLITESGPEILDQFSMDLTPTL